MKTCFTCFEVLFSLTKILKFKVKLKNLKMWLFDILGLA